MKNICSPNIRITVCNFQRFAAVCNGGSSEFLLWVVASVEVTYPSSVSTQDVTWHPADFNIGKFIQQSFISGSAQITVLLAACQRFALARISDRCPS